MPGNNSNNNESNNATSSSSSSSSSSDAIRHVAAVSVSGSVGTDHHHQQQSPPSPPLVSEESGLLKHTKAVTTSTNTNTTATTTNATATEIATSAAKATYSQIVRALRWDSAICDHVPNDNDNVDDNDNLDLDLDHPGNNKLQHKKKTSHRKDRYENINTSDDDFNSTSKTNSDCLMMKHKDSSNGSLDDIDDEDEDDTMQTLFDGEDNSTDAGIQLWQNGPYVPSIRQIALSVSLYVNLIITFAKLVAYVRTWSLSVLASLLDSVLDVASQFVLNYTEYHSSGIQKRSSALYPAGAKRLEPIGVLTCAALMGMASFEVLKESFVALFFQQKTIDNTSAASTFRSFWGMITIVIVKLVLLWLCNKGAHKRTIRNTNNNNNPTADTEVGVGLGDGEVDAATTETNATAVLTFNPISRSTAFGYDTNTAVLADPTLEALAQDHWNDCLSNTIAAIALLVVYYDDKLWYVDPVGAILISFYIIYSWYLTGKEQIEQLTGKSAPEDFIDEIRDIATEFDPERILVVDTIRAYHFGPQFLVEIEIVMHKNTTLQESHDVGMELQYEIEAREEVERCFVHIDYETRPYDEHVVSKVPALREKYRPGNNNNNNINNNNNNKKANPTSQDQQQQQQQLRVEDYSSVLSV